MIPLLLSGLYLLVDAVASLIAFRRQRLYCQAVRVGRGLIGLLLVAWPFITSPEVVTVSVPVVKEVVRVVTHWDRVETVIEVVSPPVYRPLRYFRDLDELKGWLAQDDTDSLVIAQADSNGIMHTENQCEDYALELQERALRAGYIVSTETLYQAEYYELYQRVMPPGVCHMVNLVVIGQDTYIVDPDTDQIWYWHPLD
jgi:hypothetical protein